jgi:hypothetical protein
VTKTFDFAKAQARLDTLKAGNGYDAGAISKLCASIKQRGNLLDIDIHAAAVAGLGRVADDNDTSGVAALLNAMPRGSRAKTLAEWALHFGNLVALFDKKNGMWTCKLLPKEQRKEISLDKAFARPFWDVEEKVTPGVFSLSLLVAQLIKKAEREVDTMSEQDKAALADLKVISATLPAPTAKGEPSLSEKGVEPPVLVAAGVDPLSLS